MFFPADTTSEFTYIQTIKHHINLNRRSVEGAFSTNRQLAFTLYYHTEISTFLSNLLSWANENNMEINTTKTKEMILGPLARSNLPFVSTPTGTIERVTSFKLLDLHIDLSLSWANHTTIIIQKASRRLYFLKQLKTAGLATHHLLHFYIAVIRPVLEYCAPVWHYALTKAQTQELEAIQKRVITACTVVQAVV